MEKIIISMLLITGGFVFLIMSLGILMFTKEKDNGTNESNKKYQREEI